MVWDTRKTPPPLCGCDAVALVWVRRNATRTRPPAVVVISPETRNDTPAARHTRPPSKKPFYGTFDTRQSIPPNNGKTGVHGRLDARNGTTRHDAPARPYRDGRTRRPPPVNDGTTNARRPCYAHNGHARRHDDGHAATGTRYPPPVS